MASDVKKVIVPAGSREYFLGVGQENIKMLEEVFGVDLVFTGSELYIMGDPVSTAKAYEFIRDIVNSPGAYLSPRDIERTAREYLAGEIEEPSSDVIVKTHRGRGVVPKTAGQRKVVQAIKSSDIVFVIGPAGTGKTYISVAMAVSYLKSKRVERIVLTRPVLEAGERLGFLPGDVLQKVDPYFRPLYDALYDMLGVDKVNRYIQRGIIEIAPLAYMRGRTFNDAFIILDEAQNTTVMQMKMFLTRLGWNSKMVVTGDIMQIDLDRPDRSGLTHAIEVLSGVPGIEMVFLTEKDNVRHDLVQKIIMAYKRFEGEDK